MNRHDLVPYCRHIAASLSLAGHSSGIKEAMAMAADVIEELHGEVTNCDLKHDGYAMDHYAHQIGEEIRKWWRFSDTQQPTSSWHDREDFIAKKLPEMLRALS